MNTPLAQVLQLLERRFGKGVEARVERVDPLAAGGLVLTLGPSADDERCWMRFDGALQPFGPDVDEAVPLARRAAAEHVLAYRPGRRIVLRHERMRGPFLKGFRRKRSVEPLRKHELLRDAGQPGFGIAPLIEHDADEARMTLGDVGGIPLGAGPDEAAAYVEVGAALRRFQDCELSLLTSFGPEHELDVLKNLAERYNRIAGPLPARWRETYDQVIGYVGRCASSHMVTCHRDLHDGQLLIGKERVFLLDFDLLCRADAALDPANLRVHLHLRSLQGLAGADDTSARACADALLHGLGYGDADFASRLAFYETTTFLRLSLVYGLRPKWFGLVQPLIKRAQLALEPLKRNVHRP